MARPRRGKATTRGAWSRPGAVVSRTNRRSIYEGRIFIEQSPTFDVRVDGTPVLVQDRGQWSPSPEETGLAPLASPGLLALAALALWEGYRHLNVIPSAQRHPSVYAFAVIAPVAALVLTRHRGRGRRTLLQNALVAAAVALGLFTPVALVVDGPVTGPLLGVADMLTAALALATVVVGESLASGLRGKYRSHRR